MELKHLAAYLPYGVKVTKADWGKILKMDCDGTTLNCVGIDFVLHTNAKLALRPLSDLTKEIEDKGKKFVPIEKLKDLDGEYFIHYDGLNAWIDDKCSLGLYEVTRTNELIQKLLEWKFDVFGLIEKGEAIDINTLNNY